MNSFTLIVNNLEAYNPKTNRRGYLTCDSPTCGSDRFEMKCSVKADSIMIDSYLLTCVDCGKEYNLNPWPNGIG